MKEHPKSRRIKVRVNCKGHEGRVNVCRFVENQTAAKAYFVSAGEDAIVRLWNFSVKTDAPMLLHAFKGGHAAGDVLDVSCGAGAVRLASVGIDKAVCLWDISSGDQWGRLHGHEAQINSCWFKDTSLLGTGSSDGTIRLWDTRAKSTVQVLPRFNDAVTSVWLGEDSVVGCSLDGTLRTFDVRQATVNIDECRYKLGSLAISRNAKSMLVTCVSETEASLRLVERETGRTMQNFVGHANSRASLGCCFDHEDSIVGCGSEDGIIRFWTIGDASVALQVATDGPVLGLSHHNAMPLFVACCTNGMLMACLHESIVV